MKNEPDKIIYSMIRVSKRHGQKEVLKDISLSYFYSAKIGVLGLNGAGKSTLLKILAGVDTAFEGKTVLAPGYTIGYLEQEPLAHEERTVREVVEDGVAGLKAIVREYEEINEKFSEPMDDEAMNALIERQSKVQEEMDAQNLWDLDSRIDMAMDALRCPPPDMPVSQVSGGERRRVALCRLLLQSPDILLLDEPTNHLDAESVQWLEDYLHTFPGTVIAVTHDRYFLDRVCNQIIEIDEFGLFSYSGNYAYYLEKREERIENRNAAIDKARNLLRTEQEWMRRMPQARSHKAQYRIDNFYKLKETASQNTTEKKLELDIQGKRLGKKILELDHVSKSFDGHCILRDFSYKFVRGEKIGIVGKNGVGKSTFLNIITQNLQPDSGSISIGETVVYGYYKQSGIAFNETDRVIDIVKNIAERIDLGNGRIMSASQFLEYFMFTDKQQYSLVEKLSGGERRRLYLLTVLMGNPNFLILD